MYHVDKSNSYARSIHAPGLVKLNRAERRGYRRLPPLSHYSTKPLSIVRVAHESARGASDRLTPFVRNGPLHLSAAQATPPPCRDVGDDGYYMMGGQ